MIKVDQNKCIGCGLCAGTYPDNFIINSEGKAEVIDAVVNETNKQSVDDCPVGAISIE